MRKPAPSQTAQALKEQGSGRTQNQLTQQDQQAQAVPQDRSLQEDPMPTTTQQQYANQPAKAPEGRAAGPTGTDGTNGTGQNQPNPQGQQMEQLQQDISLLEELLNSPFPLPYAQQLAKAQHRFPHLTLAQQIHFCMALEKEYEEGYAMGRNKGRAEGFVEGRTVGRAKGRKEGRKTGLAQGRARGLEAGYAQGLAEGLAQGVKEGSKMGIAQGRKEGRRQVLSRGWIMAERYAKGHVAGNARVRREEAGLNGQNGRAEALAEALTQALATASAGQDGSAGMLQG